VFNPITGQVGNVFVQTTTNAGASTEALADRALDKIIFVGASTHPVIREQAEVFKANIKNVLLYYIEEAKRAERVTIAGKIRKAGMEHLIPVIDS
jgi:hypothetical protein